MDEIRKHVQDLLKGGSAHADFDRAVSGFPVQRAGERPQGSPHSAWELLEHLRIAQRDILEFTRNPKHISPNWPEGYWPKTEGPLTKSDWIKSVRDFANLKAMMELVADPASDLTALSRKVTGRRCCGRPCLPPITTPIT